MGKSEKDIGLKTSISHLFYGFFSYTSIRQVKIDSLTVAIIFRFFQIALLTYVIG